MEADETVRPFPGPVVGFRWRHGRGLPRRRERGGPSFELRKKLHEGIVRIELPGYGFRRLLFSRTGSFSVYRIRDRIPAKNKLDRETWVIKLSAIARV
jgi:hypothetical protein